MLSEIEKETGRRKEKMEKLAQLMTLEEMQERFQETDDPFDLTIEKWARIRRFLDSTLTLDDFRELFEGATVAVPFCFEFNVKGCVGCPLGEICGPSEEKKSQRLIRLIQAYTLAGDMLPKQRLTTEVDDYLMKMKMIKKKNKGTGNKKRKPKKALNS
jgi:hypothetical protein